MVASKDGVPLGQLNAATVAFGRKIDDVSEATVTVSIVDENCCDILSAMRTWHHEIQIFRGGIYVWSGSIVTINIGRTTGTFTARDLLAVLNERIIHDPLCFAVACGTGPADLTVLGEAIINNALEVDGHSYQIEAVLTGSFGERLYSPGENALTAFQEALSLGLDCTVLGRKIILGAANGGAPFGRTNTLTCEDFLGDIQVEEDGLNGATRAILVGTGFVGIATAPGSDVNGNHPYYGLLEYTDSNHPEIMTQADADAGAAKLVAGRFPPPVTLVVPSGSALSPNAPVDINDLVPGAFTTIIADCLCRPVTADLVLTALDVTWGPEGEVVQVTYAQLTSINTGEIF